MQNLKISRLSWILLTFLLGNFGCTTLTTYPGWKTVEQRFQDFPDQQAWPIQRPVHIYWHENRIPFIEAQTDADCAFAIGVLHAHLRLGQMEVFKHLASGRLSESGGPFNLPELDRAIRTVNLRKSARLSLSQLNTEQKNWLKHYVRGINFFIKNMKQKPVEYEFLDYEIEEWTMVDALTVGRLAAGDANWGSLLPFLTLRKEQNWHQVWKEYIAEGKRSLTSFSTDEKYSVNRIFSNFSRAGSNSVVVSGDKTQRGGALIASDPHLGIFVPNLWVLMGYKSPSYHVLGYMLPAIPVVTLGRNPDVAWGGTYMRGVSSHLFEVSPQDLVSERKETIGIRGWFDETVTIRESTKGPIISDIPQFQQDDKMIALNWAGHQPSNELGTFLRVNKSRNWQEFHQSFEEYSVSGLNFTYADRSGNIGMLLAIRQPLLKDESEHFDLIKSQENEIVAYKTPMDLPSVYNPSSGFVASANNMPVKTDPQVAFVFGQSDRIRRWQTLLASNETIATQDLKNWQLDVFSQDGLDLKQYLHSQVSDEVPTEVHGYWDRFVRWDGHYTTESEGAVSFEILTWQMALLIFEQQLSNDALRERLLKSDDWRMFLDRHIKQMDSSDLQQLVVEALQKSSRAEAEFGTWGDMHKQVVQSPLGLVPMLGNRFQFEKYPSAGGGTTLNKAAFSPGFSQRNVTFGAQARHISDMSDPNENYFVMLGGNDGWLNNPHLYDQVRLWRKGSYIKLPLEMERVKQKFDLHQTTVFPLQPQL